MNGRAVDGRALDGREFDDRVFDDRVFDGPVFDDRGLKLGRFGLSSVREKEPVDFVDVASWESVRERKLGRAVFLAYFANAFGFTNFAGRSAEDRGENFGRFGFESVLLNEPVDLADGRELDGGRELDERGAKLALAGLPSLLSNEPPGFANLEGRAPDGREVNLDPVGLLSALANVPLGFPNVACREGVGRGANLGLAG